MSLNNLKKRIEFIEHIETTDTDGFTTLAPSVIKSVWAGASVKKVKPIEENEKQTSETSIIFEVRYQEIDPNWHIGFDGKTYSIEQIEDKTLNKRFLHITTKEVL